MKPTLEELMGKITQLLPLKHQNVRCPLGDTGEYDDRTDVESASGHVILSDWNSDDDNQDAIKYLVHAANHFPKLLAALDEAEKALNICWADSMAIKPEILRSEGFVQTALAIENIRKWGEKFHDAKSALTAARNIEIE